MTMRPWASASKTFHLLPALWPTAPTSGTTETIPAQRHGYYYGDYVAVIAGNAWDYGEDAGEIVIHDPIVIEILA